MSSGGSVTLDILEIGGRGDGIAEHAGRRCFVPYGLPGEQVAAELHERAGGTVRGHLIEVLTPSRERVVPPCAHFFRCGGCVLQHWGLQSYTRWKSGLVVQALSHRGVQTPPVGVAAAGIPGERRRADFVLRRQGRRLLAGFHERSSPRVVDVEACVVARPVLNALLTRLRATMLAILPEGATADAIANETDSGVDLLIRPHRWLELSLDRREALAVLAEQADLARLSWGSREAPETIVARRTPVLLFGDVRVDPPPGAFLQATKTGETAMRAAVAAWIGDGAKLADLFAGVGALSLGRHGRSMLFEGDSQAVSALEAAARRLPSGRVGVQRRDLFRDPLTARELTRFDAVLLDPPRAGAAVQCAELARSGVERVVYASCDPGTFARDARILQDGGYRLEKLQTIDQFLWSAHVESIALFCRAPLRSDRGKAQPERTR